MPKVSVIIPTHDCGRHVAGAIESVLGQSWSDFELIVVDDGSNDNTPEVVKRYAGDSRVAYIRKEERHGLPAARNTGIERASGELVAFLDADDSFLKQKLEKQVKVFERDPSCGISYTDEVYFREGGGKEVRSTRFRFSGDVFYFLKRNNFIHVSTAMIRRDLLEENRFDESIKAMGHGDWELFLKLAFRGARFAYTDEVLSRIMVRQDSMTLDKSDMMDAGRKEVGLKARAYWKEFKEGMCLFTLKGERAIFRYLKMKIKALLIGFPGRACFRMPVSQELL